MGVAASAGCRRTAGLERVKKSRPAALFTPEHATRITIGNLEDDLGLLADADWIVEVIFEQLGITPLASSGRSSVSCIRRSSSFGSSCAGGRAIEPR